MQPTKELIDELYLGAGERARRMSPEDKLFAGLDCSIVPAGSWPTAFAASFPMPTTIAFRKSFASDSPWFDDGRIAVTSDEATAAVIDALECAANSLHAGRIVFEQFLRNSSMPRRMRISWFNWSRERSRRWSSVLARHFGWIRRCRSRRLRPPAVTCCIWPTDPFSIELFLLSDDAHDQERFARRRREQIARPRRLLPTVEDVIITKLRWSHAGRQTEGP